MKRYFWIVLLIFGVVGFSGCANKNVNLNEGIVRTSEPLFIGTKPKDNKVYVKFSDATGLDWGQVSASEKLSDDLRQKLLLNGYILTDEKQNASVIINGGINYFRRTIIKDRDPFLEFGMGRRWYYAGVGYYDNFYDMRMNSYIYDAQISLSIGINDGKNIKNYTTNLNYQSSKNINSLSTMLKIFSNKISNQIIYYLKNAD
ncbi:MAG: hypothetical protein MR902_08645 [Campylobacter sp.]|nr:hypothetical protein [Campylobacter sp.]